MRYLSEQSQWIISSVDEAVLDKWKNEQVNLVISKSSKID